MGCLVVRFGIVCGPRQDPKGEAGVVAIFCGRILEGKAATIYGNGEQTRDYVYVGDVVNAILTALKSNASGVALNIGTGIETTVNELFSILATIANFSTKPEYGPARAGEQMRSVISPARATNLLGWQPEKKLADGLASTHTCFKASRPTELK